MTETTSQTRFIEANGLRFETLVAGEGGTKFALLLHGFPESNFSWRFQIPLLVSLGYEVWAPNLRGYGHSSKPAGKEAYRLKHLCQDVAGLIDAGARGRPVTLISHDWGSAIGWCFAIDQVRPLERLVIMNVPHPARMMEGLRTLKQLKKSWYMFLFQIPKLPERGLTRDGAQAIGKAFLGMAVDQTNFTPEVLDVYKANALIPGAITAMVNYYRAAFGDKELARYARAIVPVIEVPTLIVWGEADTAVGVEMSENYEGLVRDLTTQRLPNVSHWVQQEAPEKVNTILSDWLTSERL
jgi:epoxide hydrolase 4